MTEDLSYQSFSAISLHRAAKLLRRRDAQPSHRRLVGLHKQRAVSTVDPRAGLIDLLKLRVPPDPLVLAKRQTLFAADRQPFSPLGAAALQYETAVLGAHTDEKPMRPRSVTRIGLKRAFPLHSVLRKSKRTFNRSEGVRGVSNRMALCYSLRPSRAWRGIPRFPPRPMQVRSLTRVFHTCGKNCGKSQKSGAPWVRLAEFSPKRVT